MGKYLDPRYDLTFKAVFAEYPDLIISFLNALLPFKNGEEVLSVEYLPNDLVENQLGKYTIIDVRCKDNNGRQFLVEMQMYWSDEFKQRVFFNASKAYVKQADKGFHYRDLQPVYSLNLVNDIAFSGEKYYHLFQLAEKGEPDRVIEGIELVFVELPKFQSQNKAVKTMMRLWLKFLTEINEDTTVVPQELRDNPEISKAIEILERAAYTEEQLASYEKYWDMVAVNNALYYGRYDAGKEDGLKEGLKEGKMETARNLKKLGIPNETISQATGLTVDEIKML